MILNAYALSCLVWEIGTYMSSIINNNTAACSADYIYYDDHCIYQLTSHRHCHQNDQFWKVKHSFESVLGAYTVSVMLDLTVEYLCNCTFTNFVLTERQVCTEKNRTEVFFVQTEPVGQGLHKKTEVRYFSLRTERTRLIKSLLYGIYRYLYLKQTWNAWFEMHNSCVVHIWSKKTKKYQCIRSLPLKTIRRYLINNKLNYNFQLVLLFCFKMHAFVFT
jgi:hypothetical protein